MSGTSISEDREFLFSLCEEVSTSDLLSMKFLSKDQLTTRNQEAIGDSVKKFVEVLEQRLGSDLFQFLEDLLKKIGRNDLVTRMKDFKRKFEPVGDDKSKNNLNDATDAKLPTAHHANNNEDQDGQQADNSDSADPSADVRPKVFISYQWDLQVTVKQLKNKLEESGFQCWMDIAQMGGGDSLNKEIDAGITASKVMICCVTQKYCESKYCQREVTLADKRRKPIIPLLFERMEMPPKGCQLGMIFSDLIYIDMSQGAASNLPEDKLKDLYKSIKGHIG